MKKINSSSDTIIFPVLFRAEVSEYLLGVHEVRGRDKLKQLIGTVEGKSEVDLSPQLNCGK